MTVESKNVIALYLILVDFLIGSKTGELMVNGVRGGAEHNLPE